MSTFGRRPTAAPRAPRRRSTRSQFAEWSERFARTAPSEQYVPPTDEHAVFPRFPMARQGYDCVAVDEHVGDLERELMELDQELAQLRARVTSDRQVEAELQRIGEQTSSILITAHDTAQETTKAAQAEADRCLADAAANALAITEDATRQLRELEGEMTALKVTRQRLLEDVRDIAGSLSSIAEDAGERFPAFSSDIAARRGPAPVAAQGSAPEAADWAAVAAQPTEQIEVFDGEAELARDFSAGESELSDDEDASGAEPGSDEELSGED